MVTLNIYLAQMVKMTLLAKVSFQNIHKVHRKKFTGIIYLSPALCTWGSCKRAVESLLEEISKLGVLFSVVCSVYFCWMLWKWVLHYVYRNSKKKKKAFISMALFESDPIILKGVLVWLRLSCRASSKLCLCLWSFLSLNVNCLQPHPPPCPPSLLLVQLCLTTLSSCNNRSLSLSNQPIQSLCPFITITLYILLSSELLKFSTNFQTF